MSGPQAMTLEEALAHLTNGARDYAEQLRNRFPGDDAYSRTAWDIARRIDRSIEVIRKATRPVERDPAAELAEPLRWLLETFSLDEVDGRCVVCGRSPRSRVKHSEDCIIGKGWAALAAYEAGKK